MSLIRYNLAKWSAILGVLAMALTVIYFVIRTLPDAKKTIGVYASSEYQEATTGAMKIWNDQVGCTFLVVGNDVYVKGEDGAPCGSPWRPEEEWDHAATANRCTHEQPGGHWTEILISEPGNLWSQTWSIGHEIGHHLDAQHNVRGIMGSTPDPNSDKMPLILILDADVNRFRKEFCR